MASRPEQSKLKLSEALREAVRYEKVSNLLSSCSAAVAALPSPPAAIRLPDETAMAQTLSRASNGDVDAQVEMANLCLSVGQTVEDGRYIENAESWARMAADAGSERGEYSLAVVLLYRAGMLAGLGFQRLSNQLAAEAMQLLNQLADEGFEQAAQAVVTAADAMARYGIDAQFTKQES